MVTCSQLHLVDVAELHIIIDVGLSHIVAQGSEYAVQRNAHQLHLVAVDIQEILRDIGLVLAADRCQCRIIVVVLHQGLYGTLHLGGTEVVAVFQLELQASGGSQPGDGRRNHGKYLCFLDAIHFHIEALHYGFSRMFLSLAFIPVLQYDEVGGRIALFPSSHHGEAGYADVVLYFGVRIENLIYLFPYGLGTLQTRCRGKLYDCEEIAVIFFRNKRGRPFDKQQDGNQCEHRIRNDGSAGTPEQILHYPVVDSLCLVVQTIESSIQGIFGRPGRLQHQGTERRSKGQ